jgi:aspartyl-tRNA(Asn)/glutamyl-tRNA(Gln) amidotransferase subunit C
MEIEYLKKLAGLSNIDFSDAELAAVGAELDATVAFVSPVVKGVPPAGIPGMVYGYRSIDELRPDVVADSMPIEEVLKNAPQTRGRYFVVPKVVE